MKRKIWPENQKWFFLFSLPQFLAHFSLLLYFLSNTTQHNKMMGKKVSDHNPWARRGRREEERERKGKETKKKKRTRRRENLFLSLSLSSRQICTKQRELQQEHKPTCIGYTVNFLHPFSSFWEIWEESVIVSIFMPITLSFPEREKRRGNQGEKEKKGLNDGIWITVFMIMI